MLYSLRNTADNAPVVMNLRLMVENFLKVGIPDRFFDPY